MTMDIKEGDEITAEMVQTVEVGAYNLPQNLMTDKKEVVGKYATADLAAGDYILSSKLSAVPAAENAYLYNLDGTKQAISVTIKSFATGLSGKLESGDIVTVIVADYQGKGETAIPPELQYVEVISVTASSGYDANTGEVVDEKELPSTVTLLVTTEQAKVLAELEQDSELHLALVYLIKHRGIARDVVARFAKAGLLYEDAEYHNAVFVGTDTDGVPRHAHKRSANSYGKAFRLNVEGSDPRYSFHHVGTDRSLYVFEAPIDMLSYITLYPENWQWHSYVACCGTSIQPVVQILEQAPQLDTVLLCLDNDEAGHQASRRMREQLETHYSVERLIPENKDWNDDLTLSAENAQDFSMNEMR